MCSSFKAFTSDLANATSLRLENVSNVVRGDIDGEVCFRYSDDLLEEPLDVRMTANHLTTYPAGSSYVVYTSSDNCSSHVVSFLEKLSSSFTGYRVQEAVQYVAKKLAFKVRNNEEYDPSSEDDLSASVGALDNRAFGLDSGFLNSSSSIGKPDIGSMDNRKDIQRLQKDLDAAQSAGVTVGIYLNEDGKPTGIISLSVHISKLGISSTAISAWGLNSSDYLVLLLRSSGTYPDIKSCLNTVSLGNPIPANCDIRFRFGRSHVPKPSLVCAIAAFRKNVPFEADVTPRQDIRSDNPKDGDSTFSPTSMSTTINDILQDHLFLILKLRKSQGYSWDQAYSCIMQHQGTGDEDSGEQVVPTEIPGSAQDLWTWHTDYALMKEEVMSLPLIAMQFALQRLCTCTEYCMVCQTRIPQTSGALKPYVCSKPLCLYQYMSLGLGPDIEHEIVTNPYVVDLLMSLFFAALNREILRQLPKGLALKGPCLDHAESAIRLECLPGQGKLRRPREMTESTDRQHTIRQGDWLLLRLGSTEGSEASEEGEQCICVGGEEIDSGVYSYRSFHGAGAVRSMEKEDHEWRVAHAFPFCHDLDSLQPATKATCLMYLLYITPSVLEMRTYLRDAAGRDLKSWKRLNRSSLSLLRWIIASNTSHLVQTTPVPSSALLDDQTREDQGADTAHHAAAGAEETKQEASNVIQNLAPAWMQFLFAQGSLKKEARFLEIIDDMTARHKGFKKYPSLFAWHGSPLGNWHSIIRTGLDFQDEVHGRSYGNGIYLSKELSASRGYTHRRREKQVTWPNSVLNTSAAVSICEVVNRPDDFVCSEPHFVVGDVDWVQCRYLLVQVCPTEEAQRQPWLVPTAMAGVGFVDQDPAHEIRGEKSRPLSIPKRPTSTGAHLHSLLTSETRDTIKVADGAGDDPAMLMGWIKGPDASRKSLESQGTPSNKDAVEGQFRPGTLDLSSLPQLPDPDWTESSSSALKVLSREIKELCKIQCQEKLSDLGWYIDTDKVRNLFQWIVELHSFDPELPLAEDMRDSKCTSIVLEFRFGSNFPISPPFVRVIRPRFLTFLEGGGGHVTAGGAICSEMLTSSGWSPVLSMEKVFLQIRAGLCDTARPARLDHTCTSDYGIMEAAEAFRRAAQAHGWSLSADMDGIVGWSRSREG